MQQKMAWCLGLVLATACSDDRAPPLPCPASSICVDASDQQADGGEYSSARDASGDARDLDAGADRGPRTGADSGSPAASSAYVGFLPYDQSTHVREQTFGISGTFPGDSGSAIPALADALELVRWPSAELVPATVSHDAAVVSGTPITLAPLTPLSDGWYALRVRAVPAVVSFHHFAFKQSNGLPASRFHVGSLPRVRQLMFCEKADNATKVLVSFSEELLATASLASTFALSADGAAVPCTVSELVSRNSFHELTAICPSVASARSLSVQFEGLESVTGMPLKHASGGPADYTFGRASLITAECPAFVP